MDFPTDHSRNELGDPVNFDSPCQHEYVELANASYGLPAGALLEIRIVRGEEFLVIVQEGPGVPSHLVREAIVVARREVRDVEGSSKVA